METLMIPEQGRAEFQDRKETHAKPLAASGEMGRDPRETLRG
jgi:hypothetical protein